MNVEIELVRWLSQWRDPLLYNSMVLVSRLTIPLGALVPAGLWVARRRRAAVSLGLILLGATLASVALQFTLMRTRPPGTDPSGLAARFPSFPSGHAAVAFGYAMFALLGRRRAALPGFAAAVLVGISRVYLGEHYPSDIAGGAIIGCAVAATVYGCVYRRDSPSRPWWGWLLWPAAATVLLAGLAADLGLLSLALLARPGVDKVLHFMLYGAVSLFALGWWTEARAVSILGALSLIVVTEEAAQWLVPTRSFDVFDLAASLTGVAVGGWLGARAAHGEDHSRRSRAGSDRRRGASDQEL
jgi:membrane-associated phospholipid phosphatase